MKRWIGFICLIFLSISTVAEDVLTPEQFLESLSKTHYTQRLYVSNFSLTLGVSSLGASIFLDGDNQEVSAYLGGIFTGLGVLVRFFPTQVETNYQKYKEDSSISAVEIIKKLQHSQAMSRYVMAGACAVMAVFGGGESSYTTLIASEALAFALFKTPLEQRCNDVLRQEETSRTTMYFESNLDRFSMEVAIQF